MVPIIVGHGPPQAADWPSWPDLLLTAASSDRGSREWPDSVSELIVWTYDWVPEGPRGFVRDLRPRWACEEAGLAYSVRTVPFDGRQTNHLSRQPFGQVPFLNVGDLEIFESGAGLLHLARKSEKLMPRLCANSPSTTVAKGILGTSVGKRSSVAIRRCFRFSMEGRR